MAFRDLREYIGYLEGRGELERIDREVDWMFEISGWIQQIWDMKPRGPARLFEKIRDYPRGYRIFSGGLNTFGRAAAVMGLDPASTPQQIISVFKERIKHPVPTVMVSTGPVKENIHLGADINLLEFPIPWWNPRDGGRFVGTWHGCITKDPETGRRNMGMYRMMVLDERRSGIGFLPYSHLGHHYAQQVRKGEPLEMAVVIGADESVPMAALTGVPLSVDELELAGALRGEPLELVRCETVDLEVPANAEIVIEGRILPFERVPEGPFSEHAGYHSSGVRMRPVFEITAITHRNDPIFRGYLNAKPPTENHLMKCICLSAAAQAMFETQGPEGVTAVYCPPEADASEMAFIQMKPRYVGHSRNVARAFFSSCSATTYHKMVVVVDDDVDITNFGEVFWALASRVQGGRDIEVLKYGVASRSDPSIPITQGEYTDKVIIDATKKLDYPYVPQYGGHWAPVAYPPEEVMRLVNLKSAAMRGEGDSDSAAAIAHLQEYLRGDYATKWEQWRKQHYTLSPEEQEAEKSRSYPGLTRMP